MTKHLDIGTKLTIALTLILFVVALFLKGLTHDLLLEAAVFLVSVKLVLMSYKTSVLTEELSGRLQAMSAALERIEKSAPGNSRRADAENTDRNIVP